MGVPLVLASGSPRRREMLGRLGFALTIAPSDIDETPRPGEDPVGYARRLAREKALACATPGTVLAADTVVHRAGRIFGKPEDAADAERILLELSGCEHVVTTAVCVLHGGAVHEAAVSTRVGFRALSLAEVRAYVATGEPLDKAGAYGIQGLGGLLVSTISGSYTNVVGLPLAEVLDTLSAAGLPRPDAEGE